MRSLHNVERFLRDHAIAPTRFGRLVARDPRLVLDMRNGREPRPAMWARIEAYIQDHAGSQAARP